MEEKNIDRVLEIRAQLQCIDAVKGYAVMERMMINESWFPMAMEIFILVDKEGFLKLMKEYVEKINRRIKDL